MRLTVLPPGVSISSFFYGTLFLIVLHHRGHVFHEGLGARNPGKDLGFLKVGKIQIVAFLPSFKKIVIDLSQFFRNLAWIDVLSIEKTSHACMFRRR